MLHCLQPRITKPLCLACTLTPDKPIRSLLIGISLLTQYTKARAKEPANASCIAACTACHVACSASVKSGCQLKMRQMVLCSCNCVSCSFSLNCVSCSSALKCVSCSSSLHRQGTHCICTHHAVVGIHVAFCKKTYACLPFIMQDVLSLCSGCFRTG